MALPFNFATNVTYIMKEAALFIVSGNVSFARPLVNFSNILLLLQLLQLSYVTRAIFGGQFTFYNLKIIQLVEMCDCVVFNIDDI